MSEDAILAVQGLVKDFSAGRRRLTLYRLLRSQLGWSAANGNSLRVLNDINIEVRGGEVVGLVGENGAGKTTLLKTIAGLYAPTRGRVEIQGAVTLLAGLGVGMVDELSVADNINLYGALCRLHRRTIKERFDEILQWADLDGFLDAQLRTLSTGMRTRLAFAIAMHIDSELLLIDEAFAAGDPRFQEKCDRFFRDARAPRRTVLVATHNLEFVKEFCDRILWLHKGAQMAFGPTGTVLPQYLDFTTSQAPPGPR
jgi:ABC-type polysaccharide/polyol phosphate transport system ATPase subunit